MSYKVELDMYSGPLDLLLHLIGRDELTVERIPVARVADQFLAYLENLGHIDIEVAGDFLVMAARLAEMKSRALLPELTTEDDEIDPDLLSEESDLIQRLLEYRGFKDASRWLRTKFNLRALLFARGAPLPSFEEEEAEQEEETLIPEGVTVYDLLSAFLRISREVGLDEVRTMVYDDVPIEEHVQIIIDRIQKEGDLAFSHLMPPGAGKLYVIGAFLALLELIKLKKIVVDQEEDFGHIRMGGAPPEAEGDDSDQDDASPPEEIAAPEAPSPGSGPEASQAPNPGTPPVPGTEEEAGGETPRDGAGPEGGNAPDFGDLPPE